MSGYILYYTREKMADGNCPHAGATIFWQEAQPLSEVDLAGHVFGPGLFEVDERKAKELVDASQGIGHARDVAGGL